MKVPIEGMPGLKRHICDECKKPITFLWSGPSGKEFCSNECYETNINRKEGKPIMTTTASENKKATKKKSAKKVAKKTNAAKKKRAGGRQLFPDDKKITVTVPKDQEPYRGRRAEFLKAMRESATIGAYRAKCAELGLPSSLRPVKRSVDKGEVKLS